MKKLDSLRAHLVAFVPGLKENPDKLQLHADNGKVASRYGANLGFEYRFTVSLLLLDFNGDVDALFLALLVWIRANEIALLQNHDKGNDSIGFQVDVIDDTTVDISIEFPLTEAVDVRPREDGSGYDVTHRDETPPAGLQPLKAADGSSVDPAVILSKIYLNGELLICEA